MPQEPIPLTHGTYEMLDQVARLNGRVFDEDPVIAYMLLDMSREERLEYLPTYWSTLGRSALMNDAVITEADGWKAAAIVIPPGRSIEKVWILLYAGFLGVLWRIGLSGLRRLWAEFSGMTDNAKQVGLRGQTRYYYVFSIGTERAHRSKGAYYVMSGTIDHGIIEGWTGLAKAIMRYWQNKAQAENLPIWLEATTTSSRNLYLSMGFSEVEEIILGKGKVAADATLKPDGSGVPLYAMVWWPESDGDEARPAQTEPAV